MHVTRGCNESSAGYVKHIHTVYCKIVYDQVRSTRSWQYSLEIKILQGAGRSSRLIGLTRAIVLVPRVSANHLTAPSLDSYLISRFRVPQPYSAAWPAALPVPQLEPVYRAHLHAPSLALRF
jgi:hypothetical protein